MLWTANVSAIADMEQNWARLEAAMDMAGGRAKFKPMLGIYMWDYLTSRTDIPHDLMEHQLAVGLDLLRSGRAHDLIFLGSTIVDFDLRGVQRSREWIAANKDEPLISQEKEKTMRVHVNTALKSDDAMIHRVSLRRQLLHSAPLAGHGANACVFCVQTSSLHGSMALKKLWNEAKKTQK